MNDDDNELDPSDEAGKKSKSQLKREADSLQHQGEQLIQLPTQTLADMDLPEALLSAILNAKKIKSRSAWKRQRQYIGRLMRELDVEDILLKLEKMAQIRNNSATFFHTLEYWRDRILAEGDSAIEELVTLKPAADRQRLRQMQRQATKEFSEAQTPKTSRALFKYLREIFEDELNS